MKTETLQIVDRGRGPQLSTSRITVLDVFYYLHRNYDFDLIHQAMPSLSREEFDAIVAYVTEHHEELVEKDRQALGTFFDALPHRFKLRAALLQLVGHVQRR